MKKIMSFLKDEEGVTAIEYGLIAALVAVAIIAGLEILGPGLGTMFTAIGTKVAGVVVP